MQTFDSSVRSSLARLIMKKNKVEDAPTNERITGSCAVRLVRPLRKALNF